MASIINASSTLGLISSADTSGVLQLQTANTAAVTIDASQNVGVGTASPDAKLTVSQTSTPADLITLKGANSVTGALGIHALSNGGVYLQASSTRDIRLRIGSTDYATLDSVGNLGLGVTPSAWAGLTTYRSIELGTSAGTGVLGGPNDLQSFANAYYATGWKYAGTGAATSYKQGGGQHIWNTAPSGTAGNAISFTQAMTLDASGNFLVGLTSAGSVARTQLKANSNAEALALIARDADNYCELHFRNSANNSTLARLSTENGNNLSIATGGTERARFDSSGNLLIGATATIGTTTGLLVAASGANIQTITTNSTSNSAYYIGRFYSGGTEKGSIYYNGTVVSYNATSDYRLKENVQPMTGALAKVAQLKPCTYTWKENGEASQGFIAHELAEVVPECVSGEKDAVDEKGIPRYQGVDTSFLVATLTAAIQEQNQIIQQLQADVAALKG